VIRLSQVTLRGGAKALLERTDLAIDAGARAAVIEHCGTEPVQSCK
jgi:hypothetical protein